jgi:peptidoglycan-N-acetylglucosamine deacetylase
MSRFRAATLACLLGGAAMALVAPGPWKWRLIAGLAFFYLILVGVGATFIQLAFFGPAICRGRPGQNRVSLTFDDGPDPRGTPLILDLLDRFHIKAAFFVIGDRAGQYPDLVRRTAARGHLVGNHSQRHLWWGNFLGSGGLYREIQTTQSALHDLLGTAPSYFRSPMGFTNPHLQGVLQRLGLTLVGWDVRGLDQRASSPEKVIRRLLRGVRDGSIILLHDGGGDPQQLAAVVQEAVQALEARGFTFVRLDELIGEPV